MKWRLIGGTAVLVINPGDAKAFWQKPKEIPLVEFPSGLNLEFSYATLRDQNKSMGRIKQG